MFKKNFFFLAVLALPTLLAASVLPQIAGAIQGRVIDQTGTPVEAAVVIVDGADGTRRTTVTDEDGAFQVSSLALANYTVKISASSFSDWTAADVPALVNPETRPLLAALELAPVTTTVTVGLSPADVATEQVHDELQQRVLGIVPNYYVTYDPHPAPLSPPQKMHLAVRTLFDPTTFFAAGITAAIQQAKNSYRQYGQGAEGFAKRFGAAYGIASDAIVISSVAADSLFHQDPRYRYSGQGSKGQRCWYAIKSAFLARGDNGKWEPPYSTLVGGIASAELSQAFLPGSRTQYTVIGRGLMFRFGGMVGLNLAEEFFLKKATSHVRTPQLTQNGPILLEGTPVQLIAVSGFSPEGMASGNTVNLVLAQDLSVDGKVLARTGDVASGQVGQLTTASAASNTGSVDLERVNLVAGKLSIPLRSSQTRGVAGPMQYKVLPDGGKFEVTLFVATNVRFPDSE